MDRRGTIAVACPCFRRRREMKKGIHPRYMLAKVVGGTCGNTFMTGSTRPELHVEGCSNCHPFFTGKQQIVDTAGRVQRFTRRYQKTPEKAAEKAAAAHEQTAAR